MALDRNQDVLLAVIAVPYRARGVSRVMSVVLGGWWSMMMARRVMPVPIIRRIRKHRDQHRTHRRAGQHRNHDIAIGGRGVAGSDQATGQQTDLEYATEHGALLS